MGSCVICEKHAHLDEVLGGVIAADEHAVVTHLPLLTPAGASERVYLGYPFVEPRRHVAELGALTATESESIGRLASEVNHALQASEGAEHIYAAILGHGVDHLHLHLVPRYPGTPREYWWTRVDEWPQAPRGDAGAVSDLGARLRRHL